MTTPPLDDPIRISLCARHRAVAPGNGNVLRCPGACAPFLGSAQAGISADAELTRLIAPDESVALLGPAPRAGPTSGPTLSERLPQLTCTVPVRPVDGPAITPLDPSRYADALALTQCVHPHYFRPRTPEPGRYFGSYRHGQLAAMIGERFGDAGHSELSGICARPDFTHRGYAHRLIAFQTPFLHVRCDNPHALALYGEPGYQIRAKLPLWTLQRGHARPSSHGT